MNKKVPTLHMICGFLGAGKTTFAKRLAEETGAVRFSPDEWMVDLFGVNPPREKFTTYDTAIRKIIYKVFPDILANGGDVILDFGFWKRAERDHVRQLAKKSGAEAILYNLECPFTVLKERVAARTNALPGDALYIDNEAFLLLEKEWEPIDVLTESCVTIKTN